MTFFFDFKDDDTGKKPKPVKPIDLPGSPDIMIGEPEFVRGGPINEHVTHTLPGAELSYKEWVPKYYLKRNFAGFAPYQERAWNWFEGLEIGKKPDHALVECWFRGGAKSSTVEGGVVRTCLKGTRSFWLYISRTLEDANNHVMSIANVLEHVGVDRAVNAYGLAKGWSAQRLRTSNGFNILSFGLDAGARGIKLDDMRPDGILLDDVDFLGDSIDAVRKKISTIAKTCIPCGSNDVAIVFVQNEITANSVMAQTLDGRAGILQNRNDVERVPAIYDFVWEDYTDPRGHRRTRIVSGTPAWPQGKPLSVCQQDIDDAGIDSFLTECQHDIRREGVFFRNFDRNKHVVRPNATDGPCPSCRQMPEAMEHCLSCFGTGLMTHAPLPVPVWWKFYGGIDYGRSKRNPFAFVLIAVDNYGRVKVLDEIYEPQLSPEEQGEKVIACISSHHIKIGDVQIWCGPEIFEKKQGEVKVISPGRTLTPGWSMFASNGKRIADVYRGMGLYVLKAVNANTPDERLNGWGAINQHLDYPKGLTIYDGRCPNLVIQFETAPPSPKDSRDIDTTATEHLLDGLRFVLRNNLTLPESKPSEKRFMDAADKSALSDEEGWGI